MSNAKIPKESEIRKTLALGAATARNLKNSRWLLWGGPVLLVGLLLLLWAVNRDGSSMAYRTMAAQRGDLTVTVSATGNLEPTNQVDVGTEVSGTIKTVLVDYNDQVKAGEVLARLDTTKLEAQANQSRAALASARANLLQAEASRVEADSALKRLKQVRELSGGKLPSPQDLEAAESAFLRAEANEAMAKASIDEATARYRVDQTNLDKGIIVSPINGVVLKRSVEPGQTVAASLQAPVLFTLAEDLTKMELHVGVDEADVGQVYEGQQATFTVDAHPDRVFPATITQVRFGSQSTEGVVTYLTVLSVDNTDLSLRPGMTATADVVVNELHDALLVPNAALRFTPPEPEAKPSRKAGGSLLSRLFPRPSRDRQKKEEKENKKQQQVWALHNGQPVAIPVVTGASNGIMTEIVSGEVSPGQELIVEAVGKRKGA